MEKIAKIFQLGNVGHRPIELLPNYNVSPGSFQPVVVWDDAGGMRVFYMMFWRFLPKSCTDPKTFGYSTVKGAAPNLMKSGM